MRSHTPAATSRQSGRLLQALSSDILLEIFRYNSPKDMLIQARTATFLNAIANNPRHQKKWSVVIAEALKAYKLNPLQKYTMLELGYTYESILKINELELIQTILEATPPTLDSDSPVNELLPYIQSKLNFTDAHLVALASYKIEFSTLLKFKHFSYRTLQALDQGLPIALVADLDFTTDYSPESLSTAMTKYLLDVLATVNDDSHNVLCLDKALQKIKLYSFHYRNEASKDRAMRGVLESITTHLELTGSSRQTEFKRLLQSMDSAITYHRLKKQETQQVHDDLTVEEIEQLFALAESENNIPHASDNRSSYPSSSSSSAAVLRSRSDGHFGLFSSHLNRQNSSSANYSAEDYAINLYPSPGPS